MGVVEGEEELGADERGGGVESGVFFGLEHVFGFLSGGFGSGFGGGGIGVIIAAHDAGDAETSIFEPFCDTRRGQFRGGVCGDSVVIGIEGFNQVCVEMLVKDGDIGARDVEAGVQRDDLFSKVHIDEAGGGEFCHVGGEDGGEVALMVVEAKGGGVIDAADVDDGMAGG